MNTFLLLYIIVMTVVTFIAYGRDKQYAQTGQWRTSENTLMLLAAAGGSLGALAAMRHFRHKTQHDKFRYGVPAILCAQIIIFLLCE